MTITHVYIIIANEEEKVRECIVLPDSDRKEALEIFNKLREIWGGENVAFISRRIGWIPDNVEQAVKLPKLS